MQGGDSSTKKEAKPAVAAAAPVSSGTRVFNMLLPVALLAVAIAANYYLTTKKQA